MKLVLSTTLVAALLSAGPAFAGLASIKNETASSARVEFDGAVYSIDPFKYADIDISPRAVATTVTFPDGRSYSRVLDFASVPLTENTWGGADLWCVALMVDEIEILSADECDFEVNDY